ncbi:transposase [Desulfosarcina sp.]|nr:transposase [Desulfosarcina sp.]
MDKRGKVTLYGWKVWAVYEIKTGIPLAVKIDTIEKPDNLHVLAVLKQAKENVKPLSTIVSLVLDRGFLDGKDLYDIDLQGLEFVIPLKRNMEAAKDARQLALDCADLPPVTREVDVAHGYGKKRYTEKVLTTLVGVPDLLTCDWFNPKGSKPSTWQMYRRKLKVLNRNKLIVFVGQHFGIFPSHEVFMLANVPVRDIAKELNITREQIYAKYTTQPLTENS